VPLKHCAITYTCIVACSLEGESEFSTLGVCQSLFLAEGLPAAWWVNAAAIMLLGFVFRGLWAPQRLFRGLALIFYLRFVQAFYWEQEERRRNSSLSTQESGGLKSWVMFPSILFSLLTTWRCINKPKFAKFIKHSSEMPHLHSREGQKIINTFWVLEPNATEVKGFF
jgi:hypothetical protein